MNLVFAGFYYLIGIEHLAGINAGSPLKNFTEVFFFSTQTFTTVGYGRISPTGFLTSALATLEAFLGLLSLAIATGSILWEIFKAPGLFEIQSQCCGRAIQKWYRPYVPDFAI